MKKSVALTILELSEGATDDEVKKAHRKLIIANHPDKFGQDAEKRAEAEEKTKLINEARDVLLSRKWDPEYATAGTRYGAPYSYDPFAGANRGASGGQDPFAGTPFEGWPFGQGATYVWTSWDDIDSARARAQSGPRSAASGSAGAGDPFGSSPYASGNPFATGSQGPFGSAGSSPFVGFNPFDPFGSVAQPSAEEIAEQAKQDLKLDAGLIAAKLAILAGASALGFPAVGLFLYVIASIGQGIYKRLGFLSYVFMLPLALITIILAPFANLGVGIVGALTFIFAAGFDVSNVRGHIQAIRAGKKAAAGQD